MKFRFVPIPSFVWVLVPILVLLRLFEILDTWTAIGIFVTYVIVAFVAMYKNPKTRAEAEQFAQRVEEIRLQEDRGRNY